MARGDHRVRDAFGRFSVATIDIQQRVRVPRDFGTAVRWLDVAIPGAIECVASPGSAGGIQLEPLDRHLARQERFTRAVQRRGSPASVDAAENWVDVARLLVTTWRMTINEENRYSFT